MEAGAGGPLASALPSGLPQEASFAASRADLPYPLSFLRFGELYESMKAFLNFSPELFSNVPS